MRKSGLSTGNYWGERFRCRNYSWSKRFTAVWGSSIEC